MIIEDFPAASREAMLCKEGRKHCDKLSVEAKHLLQFDVFRAAEYVVRGIDRRDRELRLGKAPETIRPLIEAEVKRLWALRPTSTAQGYRRLKSR